MVRVEGQEALSLPQGEAAADADDMKDSDT